MRGYVAFIDILGFSELIRKVNFQDSFDQYSHIIEQSLGTQGTDLQYIIFSDSLVVNTENDDSESFKKIIRGISEISYELLLGMNLPICGCISVGEFSRTETNGNVMIVGTPIVEAVHYEKQQDWIGIMLSPDVIRRYPDLKYIVDPDYYNLDDEDLLLLFKNNLEICGRIRRWNIPFATESYDGLAIIPVECGEYSEKTVERSTSRYLERLDEMKLFAPNIASQKKYARTYEYIRETHGFWNFINERIEYIRKKEQQQ